MKKQNVTPTFLFFLLEQLTSPEIKQCVSLKAP